MPNVVTSGRHVQLALAGRVAQRHRRTGDRERHRVPRQTARAGAALLRNNGPVLVDFRVHMTKVEQLEREVENLTTQELATFREWFIEHDWQVWDRQLERDVAAGKLDALAEEALAELCGGETTEI